MHVKKVEGARPGRPSVQLIDSMGEPVVSANEFLCLLAVRAYSPNTVRAYAYDLQKLFLFLDESGLSVDEFTPARAMDFLGWLRLVSSSRKAQRLELGVVAESGRLLSAKTCNRVMAAVSSFFEFLIVSDAYVGRENPIMKVTDKAAARVPSRHRPALVNANKQRPVRWMLRVKTVETVPRPMSDETYQALLGQLRTSRDRAMLELMWEGGLRPGEVLGLCLEDVSYGRRRITVRKREDHPAGVQQKSRRERVVDLHEDRALPALNAYMLRERPADAEDAVAVPGGRSRSAALGAAGIRRDGAHVRPRGRAGWGARCVADSARAASHPRHPHVGRRYAGVDAHDQARPRQPGVAAHV